MKTSGKKVLYGFGIVLGASAVGLTLLAARYQAVIRPNTLLGEVPVGGLTPEAAAKKLRLWWEMEKNRPLTFASDSMKKLPSPKTPRELGIVVDDLESVKQLPIEEFGSYATRTITRSDPGPETFQVKFKFQGAGFDGLKKFVAENAGEPAFARVSYRKGQIVKRLEVSGFQLDETALPERLMGALRGDAIVQLPVFEALKRVPDSELEKIREVVTEFSTNFSAGQRNRCENIKLASSKLDGVILLPGETLSFNGTVGRRTTDAGFKLAGVYANGRHDVGIGGGICQVSTTLYNAALLANLKIKQRSNHSMPVPYVPIGRDATVDYGSLDLLIENSLDGPIAIASNYVPGRLTFTILGVKDPALKIKIVGTGHRSWGTGLKTIVDAGLPAGMTRVVEKGSSGHFVTTFREIYRDGKLVERQPLGNSHYRGATRILAVGPAGSKVVEDNSPPSIQEGPPPAAAPPPPPIERGPGGL